MCILNQASLFLWVFQALINQPCLVIIRFKVSWSITAKIVDQLEEGRSTTTKYHHEVHLSSFAPRYSPCRSGRPAEVDFVVVLRPDLT